jgi:glutaredoxin-related protein
MEVEVLGLLGDLRDRTSELRSRVRAYNAQHTRPRTFSHVTFYGGEHVVVEEDESEI